MKDYEIVSIVGWRTARVKAPFASQQTVTCCFKILGFDFD
jgi:hypothetical protein